MGERREMHPLIIEIGLGLELATIAQDYCRTSAFDKLSYIGILLLLEISLRKF